MIKAGRWLVKSFWAVILIMIFNIPYAAAVSDDNRSPAVILKKMSGFRGKNYTSVIFHFEDGVRYDEPIVQKEEIRFRLKNTLTNLSLAQKYKTYDSWVMMEKSGRDLIVRFGAPEDFSRVSHFRAQNPHRLIVKLYKGRVPAPDPQSKIVVQTKPYTASLVSNGAAKLSVTPAKVAKKALKKPVASLEQKVIAAKKAKPILEPTVPKPVKKVTPKVQSSSDELFMTLNFFQADIQKVLSAIAMQNEINIISTKDVTGKISVHLYRVPLQEALKAVTLAGGFSYLKKGALYYVYKPKEEKDPQSEKLIVRVFKLKYADSWIKEDFDKVKEILGSIPGMRTINMHESSKTIIVEDTPGNIKKIEAIISFWDTMPRQVMIEAQILEITLTDDMTFGVNWEKYLGGGSGIRIGTGGLSTATLPTTAAITPITGTGVFANMITGIGTSAQFALALDALRAQTDINTLSMPKILAIHGKEATVMVGGSQGYAVTTTTEGVTKSGFEFLPTGTRLIITPYIDDQDNVLLDVEPSIDSATLAADGTPQASTTSVNTRLLVRDGQTVFIGGLIRKQKNKTKTGIPCLGGLPGFGAAFRRDVTGTSKTELVILISPQILESAQKALDQEAAKDKVREAEEKIDREREKNKEPLYKRTIKRLNEIRKKP